MCELSEHGGNLVFEVFKMDIFIVSSIKSKMQGQTQPAREPRCGLMWSGTEFGKKQAKYKHSELWKEKRGVRNTYSGKDLSPCPGRGGTS